MRAAFPKYNLPHENSVGSCRRADSRNLCSLFARLGNLWGRRSWWHGRHGKYRPDGTRVRHGISTQRRNREEFQVTSRADQSAQLSLGSRTAAAGEAKSLVQLFPLAAINYEPGDSLDETVRLGNRREA